MKPIWIIPGCELSVTLLVYMDWLHKVLPNLRPVLMPRMTVLQGNWATEQTLAEDFECALLRLLQRAQIWQNLRQSQPWSPSCASTIKPARRGECTV